jgi:hypothetical protein
LSHVARSFGKTSWKIEKRVVLALGGMRRRMMAGIITWKREPGFAKYSSKQRGGAGFHQRKFKNSFKR